MAMIDTEKKKRTNEYLDRATSNRIQNNFYKLIVEFVFDCLKLIQMFMFFLIFLKKFQKLNKILKNRFHRSLSKLIFIQK